MRLRTAAVCLFVFSLTAFAQSDRGSITGVVSDPAGAVVANAPVEAKNAETGVVSQAASTATGNYTLQQLPAGTYEITVNVPGFKKYIRTGLTVQALQTLRIDVTLEIGSNAESVTVTEVAALLKTETGDVSHNVTSTRLNDLPVGTIGAVRNPLTVSQLLPGTNVVSGSTLRISGTPVNSEQVRVDGLDATYSLGMSSFSFAQPSVDAIQEIAVQTSNYAAEFGQTSGAVFNLTMKSGTNQFHGTVYEYLANEALNSSGAYSHSKGKSRRSDYGGTVGGPIWIPKIYNGRDKTFFFFNYESSPNTTLTVSPNPIPTVPTADYRAGNFNAAALATGNKSLGVDPLNRPIIQNSIYDPRSQRPVSATDGRLIRDPFVGNVIPAAQLDPVALAIQKLVPLPQGPNATQLINNYINPFTTKQEAWVPSIKIDHSLNSKMKISGFWGWTHSSTPSGTNTTAEGLPSPVTTFAATYFDTVNYRLNYDHSLTPTMLLHLGMGYQQSVLNMPSLLTNYDVTKELGLKGPFEPHGFPNFSGPTGTTSTLLGPNNTGGMIAIGPTGFQGSQKTLEQKTTAVASVTWIKDSHSYKAGGELRVEGYPNYNIQRTNGLYNFSQNETGLPYLNAAGPAGSGGTVGLPYASFLLGIVDNGNFSRPAVAKLGKHSLGFFVQDSWKVTRKFTLEYGLRYDFSTYQREQYGTYGSFSATTPNPNAGGHSGAVIYEATCGCSFAHNYPWAFGPRLGFAYQVTPKTVVRGGAGLIYNGTANNNIATRSVTSNNIFNSNGFGQGFMTLGTGVPLTLSQIAYPNFSAGYFPVGGGVGGGPTSVIDQNAGRPSRSYQWSIGVQREIFKDLVVDASYVGNRGMWYPTATPINYNVLRPQDLAAVGLDITQKADRDILAATIGSAAAGRFQNKLPFAGFPTTQTVAQSLRPFPQFNSGLAAQWAPLGDTWYNSLQLKVTKRFSHGIDFTYNFTYAQELTNGVESDSAGPFGVAAQENDIFNRAQNKYISAYSRPLVSNIAFNYTVPKWGPNKILKYIIGDWQIGSIMTYASGIPLNVPTSQNLLASQLFRGTFMNRNPGVPLFTQDLNCHCFDPTKTLVLNPAAWSDPAPGTWGTSTAYYNDYRQQRQPAENITVGRQFTFKERFSLSIRAEFVNAFNRTRLPNPAPSATAAGIPNNPLTSPTCFVSGTTGPTGACQTGATYASGFGFEQTAGISGNVRTGQLVARIRF
ncbi:MAG: Cna B-type protein [Bryobacterales bacterium]|nr:Cna B-type protein [Bryobacterales bacterium]